MCQVAAQSQSSAAPIGARKASQGFESSVLGPTALAR